MPEKTDTEDSSETASEESVVPESVSLRDRLLEKATLHLLFRGLHPLPPSPSSVPLPPLDLDALEKLVQCSICWEPLTETQILHLADSAIHRFCRLCIIKWLTADSVDEVVKLEKKSSCPLCIYKANNRMIRANESHDKVVSLVKELLSSEQNEINLIRNGNTTAMFKSLSLSRSSVGVRIRAIPGLKNDQIQPTRSSYSFIIFEGPLETTVGSIALYLLKERADTLVEEDLYVDATPFTYPYLITYKKRSSRMYVPLPETATLSYIRSTCKHESAKLKRSTLDLYFAYKVVGPK